MPGAAARTSSERRIPMSSPGCQRYPSTPNGEVMVPSAGQRSPSCQPASVCAAAAAGKRSAAASAAQSPRLIGGHASSRLGSEDFRAVRGPYRAEERACTLERARAKLADPLRTRELVEVEGAEVDGGEILGVELEVGGMARLPRLVSDSPASRVPGAELVAHLENDRNVGGIGAGGERRLEVDETQPEPVGEAQMQTTGVLDH